MNIKQFKEDGRRIRFYLISSSNNKICYHHFQLFYLTFMIVLLLQYFQRVNHLLRQFPILIIDFNHFYYKLFYKYISKYLNLMLKGLSKKQSL